MDTFDKISTTVAQVLMPSFRKSKSKNEEKKTLRTSETTKRKKTLFFPNRSLEVKEAKIMIAERSIFNKFL